MKCHTKPSGPENCTVCHGGVNAAPPRDVLGNTARSNILDEIYGEDMAHDRRLALFAEVRRLNPHVKSVDVILAGDVLRLPSPGDTVR